MSISSRYSKNLDRIKKCYVKSLQDQLALLEKTLKETNRGLWDLQSVAKKAVWEDDHGFIRDHIQYFGMYIAYNGMCCFGAAGILSRELLIPAIGIATSASIAWAAMKYDAARKRNVEKAVEKIELFGVNAESLPPSMIKKHLGITPRTEISMKWEALKLTVAEYFSSLDGKSNDVESNKTTGRFIPRKNTSETPAPNM